MISAEEARGKREPTKIEMIEQQITDSAAYTDNIVLAASQVDKQAINVLMTYGYKVDYNKTTESYRISWRSIHG